MTQGAVEAMGVLTHGGNGYVFDDRLLSHLQVVIITKLRRRESFLLTWTPEEPGYGREALWIDTGIPLHFQFDELVSPPLNRDWLEKMLDGTHRPNGLHVMDEPPMTERSESHRAGRSRVVTPVATRE